MGKPLDYSEKARRISSIAYTRVGRPALLSVYTASIGGIVRNIDGFPIMVGGVENHIHILSSLPKNMTLADFVRTVKANSSKWLKTVDMYYSGFEWQTGYGAFSVSQSLIEQTERYIRNQERHHAKQSFNTEIRAILDAHEMEYDEQYLLGEYYFFDYYFCLA